MAAEARVKGLEAEVERLRKKCDDTAFAWAAAVDKAESMDVELEKLKGLEAELKLNNEAISLREEAVKFETSVLKAIIRDREATIVSQQDELHALRMELDCIRNERICGDCEENHRKKYLCLEKHGAEEEPEKSGYYSCLVDNEPCGTAIIELYFGGGNWTYGWTILGWYSLPEKE